MNTPVSGYVTITVDNTLTKFAVNGKEVSLQGIPNLADWTKSSSFPATIKPGDLIEITGSNAGGPAGILATITYLGTKGPIILNTNGSWKCGGNSAVFRGNNGSSPWGEFKDIHSQATWIWNSSNDVGGETTTCSIVAPDNNPNTNATIYVGVDDILQKILINGNPVDLSLVNDLTIWSRTRTVPAFIRPGDSIEIFGKNTGGPAQMIATIKYPGLDGNTVTLNTSEAWSCGGDKALNLGNNGVTPWVNYPNIESSAVFIWNSKINQAGDETSCKIIAPSVMVRPKGRIQVTVDNVLTKITINGEPLDISAAVNKGDWRSAKSIPADISPHDEIEIFGYNDNTGGPAGILASISYTGSDGKPLTVVTNKDWECGDAPAVLKGKNGVSPWGAFSIVNNQAEWIWNSWKTVVGDATSCKIALPDSIRVELGPGTVC